MDVTFSFGCLILAIRQQYQDKWSEYLPCIRSKTCNGALYSSTPTTTLLVCRLGWWCLTYLIDDETLNNKLVQKMWRYRSCRPILQLVLQQFTTILIVFAYKVSVTVCNLFGTFCNLKRWPSLQRIKIKSASSVGWESQITNRCFVMLLKVEHFYSGLFPLRCPNFPHDLSHFEYNFERYLKQTKTLQRSFLIGNWNATRKHTMCIIHCPKQGGPFR